MKQKIAVVGSGISGLAAAWLLNQKHEVHLFEKRNRLGGHTHTVDHSAAGGNVALDTGFIVFNELTYPNLTKAFAKLNVETQTSDMSFAVSCQKPDLEYSGRTVQGLFAQPQNLLRPWYLGFLRDIWRFGRIGNDIIKNRPDPSATLGRFLKEEGFSAAFGKFFLLPMAAAIWSTGTGPAHDFPRDTLLHFFNNHGLLKLRGQPEWKTVVGGSSSYISAMTRGFADRIHLGNGIDTIQRSSKDVKLQLSDGSTHSFDHVVIAAHADQALAMLAQPTPEEQFFLGAWKYSKNDTWLHTDTNLMPRRTSTWSSWNYLIDDAGKNEGDVSVSYHLNRLQRIESDHQYIVTLNPLQQPRPETVIRRMTYHHPIYDKQSVMTQAQLLSLNGKNRSHFCGAYFRNGFHEDGFVSALHVAEDFGISL